MRWLVLILTIVGLSCGGSKPDDDWPLRPLTRELSLVGRDGLPVPLAPHHDGPDFLWCMSSRRIDFGDGRILADCSFGRRESMITLFDLPTGTVQQRWHVEGGESFAAIVPRGAARSEGGSIVLYNHLRVVLLRPDGSVDTVAEGQVLGASSQADHITVHGRWLWTANAEPGLDLVDWSQHPHEDELFCVEGDRENWRAWRATPDPPMPANKRWDLDGLRAFRTSVTVQSLTPAGAGAAETIEVGAMAFGIGFRFSADHKKFSWHRASITLERWACPGGGHQPPLHGFSHVVRDGDHYRYHEVRELGPSQIDVAHHLGAQVTFGTVRYTSVEVVGSKRKEDFTVADTPLGPITGYGQFLFSMDRRGGFWALSTWDNTYDYFPSLAAWKLWNFGRQGPVAPEG